MLIRRIYENVLIELNKVLAPSLLLDDFVYLFNRCILQYFNKRYSLFEVNQQLTDDLRVLTKTEKLNFILRSSGTVGSSYKCELPEDYVHILNCICEFKDNNPRCDNGLISVGAHKLDTDKWSSVISNYYMRPSIKLPYYYIINIDEPDPNLNYPNESGKLIGTRYGNSFSPVMEIKFGDNPRYSLENVYIDYLRSPKYVDLSVEDLDSVDDLTELVEFPDYVIYEIIKEIVTTCLENAKDLRLQTFVPISQSIPQK